MLSEQSISNFVTVNKSLTELASIAGQVAGKRDTTRMIKVAAEYTRDVTDILTAALAVYNSATSHFPVEQQAMEQLLHAVAKFEG